MSEIDSYKYWMEQLANRSESTREVYELYFNNFLDYMKTTPNQLIEMQRQAMKGKGDPRLNHVVEGKVRAWLADLQEKKSPATCRLALSAVKSFFDLNEHPLKMKRRDRPQGESAGSRIPEKDEVILILDAARWKRRAAIMFLKDSGLRISDIVRLRWADKVDLGDGFWNFTLITKKRKVAACSFIGPETTRLLKTFKTKEGLIFGTTRKILSRALNHTIEKAGVHGVSVHGLRKFFVTSMQHARVPEQYYLHMMGKKSSVYSETRRSELFAAYKKAYPELSVYAQKQQTEELQKLKKELLELRAMVKELAQKQG